mmetsp:Transcript_12399/g.22397  ORF Transcript_12399/g.22397 Transcript_12399/m.22397 type:complete len:101 (+) Transcript_12399:840-1142(+)
MFTTFCGFGAAGYENGIVGAIGLDGVTGRVGVFGRIVFITEIGTAPANLLGVIGRPGVPGRAGVRGRPGVLGPPGVRGALRDVGGGCRCSRKLCFNQANK